MSICRAFVVALALVLSLAACAQDGLDPGETGQQAHRFETWQARRFRNVVRQTTDFSCGAASLATLSRYYLDRPISETEVLDALRETYSPEEWEERERDGLTMLDLGRAARHFGFATEGARMTLQALENLRGPVIVHLDKEVVKHFSVLRGIRDGRVYLADPVGGDSRMPIYRFLDQWTGYALLVWRADRPLPEEYALALDSRDAEVETAAARSALYRQTPPRPGPR